nr:MAG TPA: hypothetical protein [Caudoviricetes sp.]
MCLHYSTRKHACQHFLITFREIFQLLFLQVLFCFFRRP